jgi:hypothetical protein
MISHFREWPANFNHLSVIAQTEVMFWTRLNNRQYATF